MPGKRRKAEHWELGGSQRCAKKGQREYIYEGEKGQVLNPPVSQSVLYAALQYNASKLVAISVAIRGGSWFDLLAAQCAAGESNWGPVLVVTPGFCRDATWTSAAGVLALSCSGFGCHADEPAVST